MAGHFPDNPDKILERTAAVRVATMLTAGQTVAAVARELGISTSRVRTIMKSDECIRCMREIASHEKEFAKARAAQRAGEMIDECFRVIKERLKRNDLKAVSLTLKASGVFDEVESASNDAQLVVVMPGASVPGGGAIDVTPKGGE